MTHRVLVADDDPVVCKLLDKALQEQGFEVDVVHQGEEAAARLEGPSLPSIALLDWLMPSVDGTEVCRRARKAPGGERVYLFLMSGRQRAEDMIEALESGADEFVSKPFDVQVLMARIQAAIRRYPEGKQESQRLTPLLAGLHGGMTGEIIVRSQSRTGRIILYQGKIAWIHLPGGSPLLPLLGQIGVAEDDARMVLEECQKTRLPFMDTLVNWNLVPKSLLKNHVRIELARRLNSLMELTDTASFFIPGEAAFQSGFSYDLSELDPFFDAPPSHPRRASAGPSSRPIPEQWARVAREAEAFPGVESVALIDLPTGTAAYQAGKPFDRDLLIGLLRVLRATHDEQILKTLLTSKTHFHVLQVLSETWLLYLKADQEKNRNVALIQFQLQELLRAAQNDTRSPG